MKIEVKGSSEKPYIVDTEELTCTCPNRRFKCRHFTPDSDGRLCKHLFQVFEEHPELKPYILKKKDQVERQSLQESDGVTRYPRPIFDIYVSYIKSLMDTNSSLIKKYEICGEYRTMQDMVGSIDVVFVMNEGQKSDSLFNQIEMNGTVTKVRRDIDQATYLEDAMIESNYIAVSEDVWAFAVLFRTGPTDEVLRLKRLTEPKGYDLTPLGFKDSDGKYHSFDITSEEGIYQWLNTPYKQPWDR